MEVAPFLANISRINEEAVCELYVCAGRSLVIGRSFSCVFINIFLSNGVRWWSLIVYNCIIVEFVRVLCGTLDVCLSLVRSWSTWFS